eukprot:FR735024.1.p3 GENE.FR735024.1~~FR735024.1.p3  ORF type:complete len:108 (+),score=68.53 FR735024.1:912-1235(+)
MELGPQAPGLKRNETKPPGINTPFPQVLEKGVPRAGPRRFGAKKIWARKAPPLLFPQPVPPPPPKPGGKKKRGGGGKNQTPPHTGALKKQKGGAVKKGCGCGGTFFF